MGETVLETPYKIDTGSEGNLMPLYIFQKLFKNMSQEQLKRSVKGNIKLKMYNGMHIMQLGTCMVHVKFKNVRKVLVGMPDMMGLNIINLNIDSIQAVTLECKTNREQETQASIKDCTNMSTSADKACKNNNAGVINKQNTNGQNDPSDQHMSINYFYSSNNVDADKRSSIAMMQSIHTRFCNYF